MIEQPDFIFDKDGKKIELYQHQLKSIYEMEKLENNKKRTFIQRVSFQQNDSELHKREEIEIEIKTNVGFFADLPGYGKTISMCALIARDFKRNIKNWNLNVPYVKESNMSLSDGVVIKKRRTLKKLNNVVVVCSSNLVHQWIIELERCNLSYYKIARTKNVENLNVDNCGNYNVILISSNFFHLFLKKFLNYVFRRFVLDELMDNKIKNMKDMEINADFYWLISATIYNNKGFANRSVFFTKLIPHDFRYFEYITVKNDDNLIKESVKLPKPKFITYYYKSNFAYKALNGLVTGTVQKLLHNGNIDEAMSILQCKPEENIFEAVIRNFENKIQNLTSMPQNLQITRRLNELTNQRNILKERLQESIDSDCAICLSQTVKPVITPCCYQTFCSVCLLTHLTSKTNCPYCRSQIETTNLIYQSEKSSKSNNEKMLFSQKQTAINVIESILKDSNRRILFFSEYDSIYDSLKVKLDNIKIRELKGLQITREKILMDFREGNIDILYLNSIANSSGLNLIEATDIIIYHKMDNTIKDQIIGRAIRIGSKKQITIHQLIQH